MLFAARKGLILIAVVVASMSALSADIHTNGSGTLLGASGIVIGGQSYDVVFGGSTCIATFGGCDEQADFLFASEVEAIAASQALLDQVLLDFAVPDTFDADPETNIGCTNSGLCRIMTVYAIDGDTGNALGVTADNHSMPGDPDVVSAGIFVTPTTDLSTLGPATFARWTTTAVPLPSALLLFVGSLSTLLGLSRRAAAGSHAAVA